MYALIMQVHGFQVILETGKTPEKVRENHNAHRARMLDELREGETFNGVLPSLDGNETAFSGRTLKDDTIVDFAILEVAD